MDSFSGSEAALAPFPRHACSSRATSTPRVDLYRLTLHGDATLGLAPVHAGAFEALAERASVSALLTPLGLLDLFRTPFAKLAGARPHLSSWCASSRQHELCAELMRQASPRAFAQWIETRLAEVAPLSGAALRVARAVMAICESQHASVEVCELARNLRVTRRQLERDFRHWLGVSPMAYARRVRFVRAAAALAEGASILDAAIDHGFADQSHMTRVFAAFAHATPREFARSCLLAPARGAQRHFT